MHAVEVIFVSELITECTVPSKTPCPHAPCIMKGKRKTQIRIEIVMHPRRDTIYV